MKRSALVSMGLALILLVGAAFKCGSDNRNTGGSGSRDNRNTSTNSSRDNGGPPATTSDGLKLGEYACYGSDGRVMIAPRIQSAALEIVLRILMAAMPVRLALRTIRSRSTVVIWMDRLVRDCVTTNSRSTQLRVNLFS